jgi:hypothetical protein
MNFRTNCGACDPVSAGNARLAKMDDERINSIPIRFCYGRVPYGDATQFVGEFGLLPG